MLSVNSENTSFVEDIDNNCVYTISIIENYLCITDFNDLKKKFVVETLKEDIVEVYCRYGIFFIMTVEEVNDDEQKKRLYLVDLFADKMLQIKNTEILESYHLPYILNINGNIKILIEDAKVFPYELRELKACVGNDIASNKILVVSIDKFINAEEKQKPVSWEKSISCDEWDLGYMQVLGIQDNMAILAFTDETKHCTQVRWIDIETGYVKEALTFCNKITDILMDKGIVVAYVSWTEKMAVYDLEGNLISEIFTEEFYNNNDNLELNSMISMVNKNIIFEAADYNTDDEKQIRVLYDTFEKSYKVYHSPFVKCGNECY